MTEVQGNKTYEQVATSKTLMQLVCRLSIFSVLHVVIFYYLVIEISPKEDYMVMVIK